MSIAEQPLPEKNPADMTNDERREAALRTHYEMVRQLREMEMGSAFQAELAGATAEEIQTITQAAVRDDAAQWEEDAVDAPGPNGERVRVEPAG
jgi:hypothetical protein